MPAELTNSMIYYTMILILEIYNNLIEKQVSLFTFICKRNIYTIHRE